MADIKISQLPVYTNAETNSDDVMPIVDQQAGVTKKISLHELDLRWRALPSGGTIAQVLAKLTATDGDVGWITISKSSIGLGQVNNTADIDKPLSTAMISALNTKASTASVLSKAEKSYVDNELFKKIDKPAVAGANGQVLTIVGGVPTWENAAGSSSNIKYWGDPNVDGSWRERVDGTFFKKEVRKDGGWVLVSQFNSEYV